MFMAYLRASWLGVGSKANYKNRWNEDVFIRRKPLEEENIDLLPPENSIMENV